MKKKIVLFLVLVLTIFTVGCQQPEDAQNSGKLIVQVTDKEGSSLEKAEVALNEQKVQNTNSEGIVSFTNLTTPQQKIKVTKSGYKPAAKEIALTKKETKVVFKLQEKQLVIGDASEYIDINDNKVQFLFKSNISKGEFSIYLGKQKDNLNLKKTVSSYDNKGLNIKNLKPGQKYYYKIKVKTDNRATTTKTLSFTKEGNTNNWEPADWAKDAVFYEIFVRSFYDGNGDDIGDFAGLKKKIPYLKELGVDALWLMPINTSPSYHGYDVVDYYDTDPEYGSKEEFREFLKVAHKNGIKVIMDLVVNHSSSQHPWFQKAAYEENSEYRDYYVWRDQFDHIYEKGDWGQKIWHTKFGTDYFHGVFWSEMPDLNYRNEVVREKMKDIAQYWLDPNGDGDFSDGVDGYRLDAALHIDEDPDVTHNWWQEFNTAVKEVNPDAFLVGENWTETKKMAKFYKDLDASFNFSLADKMIKMANGTPVDILKDVKNIHQQYAQYSDEYIDATFLRNHDQNRVGYEVDRNRSKMKLSASLLLTLPGTPFIYYGEELGQIGAKPDDNIREPFDWYKEAEGKGMTTMSKGGFYHGMKYTEPNDGISLEEQRNMSGSVFKHYKKLIEIRKENPMFFQGNYSKIETPNLTYGYQVSESDVSYDLYVVHNLSEEERQINISTSAKELISGDKYSNDENISLSSYDTVILKSNAEQMKITGQDIKADISKVTFVVEVAEDIQTDGNIYLASNLSNWKAEEDYKLTKRKDGKYEITVTSPIKKSFSFKFKTKNKWEDTIDRENNGAEKFDGSEYNNRVYKFDGTETVNLKITAWEEK